VLLSWDVCGGVESNRCIPLCVVAFAFRFERYAILTIWTSGACSAVPRCWFAFGMVRVLIRLCR